MVQAAGEVGLEGGRYGDFFHGILELFNVARDDYDVGSSSRENTCGAFPQALRSACDQYSLGVCE